VIGLKYKWSNGDTTNAIWVKTSGTYSVIIIANGCPDIYDTTVVTAKPYASTNLPTNLKKCKGDSVWLNASSLAGSTYSWSNGLTTDSILITTSGQYIVDVNLNGCYSHDTSNVIFYNVPLLNLPSTINFCAGDSVLLTASGGVRYIWSTGQTGSSIKVSSPGSYTVNSLLGTCRSAQSAAIVVTNIVSPTLPIVTALGSTTLCTGESVILSSSLATGNRWYRNGIALTGQTAQTLFVNQAGSYYTQTAPNANGCIRKSTTISVTLNYVDRTRLATVSSNNICPGTQVQLRSNS